MNTIQITMDRLGMDKHQMAAYLGVPTSTLHNWLMDQRKPGASTERLLYVLGVIEALAPAIHDTLVPEPTGYRPRQRAVNT